MNVIHIILDYVLIFGIDSYTGLNHMSLSEYDQSVHRRTIRNTISNAVLSIETLCPVVGSIPNVISNIKPRKWCTLLV